jgi:hypothetical protein
MHGVTLPEGVKHLHGALHLVPFDMITIADKEPAEDASKGYKFSNPRSLTDKGQAVLLDKKNAEILRADICERTLMAPFICRWAEENGEIHPQLVGGERRHRAVDKLRTDKTSVRDANSAKLNGEGEYEYEYRPANEVYAFVPCQIYSAKSDIDALAYAYSENSVRTNLTDGHDIAICQELRRSVASDEKIMEIMHKDARWLRDTDSFINSLDEDSLKDLIEDRIDRDSAKALMEIEDIDTRTQVRESANAESADDSNRRRARYQKRVLSALEEQEIAAGSVADAEYTGNEDAKAVATKTLANADAKVKRTIDDRDSKKSVTKKKHIVSATKSVTGSDPTNKQSMRAPKIKEHYVDYLASIIDNDGKAPDDSFQIDTKALEFGLAIAKGILSGQTNCADICRKFIEEE